MEIKTNWQWPEGLGEGKKERVKPSNMYKGSMDKDNRLSNKCGIWGMGKVGENNGVKMGTTVTEHQYNKLKKKYFNKFFI